MKKFALLFIALIMSPLTQAADFKEGTDYFVVSKVATAKPEVVEYFSLLCSACFRFESLMPGLKKSLPSDVTFRKNHTENLGGTRGVAMAKVFAITSLLKQEDEILPKIFNAIHVQKIPMSSVDDARPIFLKSGVSEKKFNAAVKSFKLKRTTDQMRQNTNKFHINSVPSFIINGKYQVNSDNITTAEKFNELVVFLAQKKD